MSERVLAGDVGGTNARLAVVEIDGGVGRVVERETVPVADHEGLAAPLRAFLEGLGAGAPARACLGVAGKIEGRVIHGVNCPWVIDADALERETPLERVTMVNDFHAAAAGVGLVSADKLHALGGGPAREGQPVAVLGAGTGLGQAFVIPTNSGPRVVGTEGGHRDFGPRTPLQDRLLAHLREQHGRVSTERVLSGPGLEAIYRFLVEAEGRPACAAVEAAPAAPPAISAQGQAGDPTCAVALDVFVDVYGAEAGNVALTVLADGGVYLAGGIAPKLLTQPRYGEAFRRSFEDKGRFRDWMEKLPVWIVLDADLGLLGAAACA